MQAHNKMSTLLKLDCADKKAHHPDALSPGVMPFHPSVVVAAGRKGSGKGATVKQLLMLAAPAYDKRAPATFNPPLPSPTFSFPPGHKYILFRLA